MAKRIVAITTLTPTATADTTNLVDATYPFILQGASSTQRTNIWEVMISGQASTTTPTFMLFARDSQIGSGSNTLGTGQTDAAMDAATAALAAPVVVGNSNATNKPQRSSTLHLMNLSLQAYGGVIRWAALDPTECPSIVGNTASLGEVSLSAFTGGTPGAIGAHCVYETL